jgi:hypothetical protein
MCPCLAPGIGTLSDPFAENYGCPARASALCAGEKPVVDSRRSEAAVDGEVELGHGHQVKCAGLGPEPLDLAKRLERLRRPVDPAHDSLEDVRDVHAWATTGCGTWRTISTGRVVRWRMPRETLPSSAPEMAP